MNNIVTPVSAPRNAADTVPITPLATNHPAVVAMRDAGYGPFLTSTELATLFGRPVDSLRRSIAIARAHHCHADPGMRVLVAAQRRVGRRQYFVAATVAHIWAEADDSEPAPKNRHPWRRSMRP